jgi:hypothetical protein
LSAWTVAQVLVNIGATLAVLGVAALVVMMAPHVFRDPEMPAVGKLAACAALSLLPVAFYALFHMWRLVGR